MHYLFNSDKGEIFYLKSLNDLSNLDISKLLWLFNDKKLMDEKVLNGDFLGPRKEMITPWSTNAVEITQNMGIEGVLRIEKFYTYQEDTSFDHLLNQKYTVLDENTLNIDKKPEPIQYIDDIDGYNASEGLALSSEEIEYLRQLSKKLNRKLTDSEIFGFSQVNSEHCRHKIFNGVFILDGEEQELSLFQLIRKTSNVNHNRIVSAYSDNVAFIEGPEIKQFTISRPDLPTSFYEKKIKTVISLKAETHNFPTTVEPFNGAATGTGGEIRDRMAGGKGSFPLTGSAVYMTSFTRLEKDRPWEQFSNRRKWLYHDPVELLIKASNGASDFGNKFGQPLINGSVLTFEYFTPDKKYGYDKVI
ncbi:MAG TPA: phosphoribosylformylglycinamidine synthase, partial [Bacteroidetes bacterium]|nr:phosphoribosylformylglycinamidine synthase [Bacteroidota bacterium]